MSAMPSSVSGVIKRSNAGPDISLNISTLSAALKHRKLNKPTIVPSAVNVNPRSIYAFLWKPVIILPRDTSHQVSAQMDFCMAAMPKWSDCAIIGHITPLQNIGGNLPGTHSRTGNLRNQLV